jgi:phosphocarrier protein HPr
MITKEYIILAPEGMHARPATALIKLTKKFRSSFNLKKDEKTVRLNSMLNILAMGAKGGESIFVIVEGEDETDAAAALDEFFNMQLKNL